jgi:hypothetical protein
MLKTADMLAWCTLYVFIFEPKTLSGARALTPALSNPSVAFPLRLQQGLLQKTDEREAYLTLLAIMARTPRGSWSGHPSFGFQEFFPEITKEGLNAEARCRIANKTAQEINSVLFDLGLTRYFVDSLVLEPLQRQGSWAAGATEQHGVTLMLRENGSERASGYLL